jgi:hypothetical protein
VSDAKLDGMVPFKLLSLRSLFEGRSIRWKEEKVNECSVMSIRRNRLITHTKRLPTHIKRMAHVSLTLLLWLQRALMSTTGSNNRKSLK